MSLLLVYTTSNFAQGDYKNLLFCIVIFYFTFYRNAGSWVGGGETVMGYYQILFLKIIQILVERED